MYLAKLRTELIKISCYCKGAHEASLNNGFVSISNSIDELVNGIDNHLLGKEKTSQEAPTFLRGLDLSVRPFKALKAVGIDTLEKLLTYSRVDLLKIPNFGRQSLREARDQLRSRNLKLKGDHS